MSMLEDSKYEAVEYLMKASSEASECKDHGDLYAVTVGVKQFLNGHHVFSNRKDIADGLAVNEGLDLSSNKRIVLETISSAIAVFRTGTPFFNAKESQKDNYQTPTLVQNIKAEASNNINIVNEVRELEQVVKEFKLMKPEEKNKLDRVLEIAKKLAEASGPIIESVIKGSK